MKLQILSDLHFEFFNPDDKRGCVTVHPEADVLVLAGDIDKGQYSLARAQKIYAQYGIPIIWVPGNHEYYGQDMTTLKAFYEQHVNHMGQIYPLMGNSVVIDNVRFVGASLWTDFKLYQHTQRMPTQDMAIAAGQRALNDFRLIRESDKIFTAKRSVELFNADYAAINQVLSETFEGKTVVVTHHGPHKNSVAPKYQPKFWELDTAYATPHENTSWMINPAFTSHVPELVEKAHVWFHGHTHESLDYQVGQCRVVANPRGYPLNNNTWENQNFDPLKLIEI